MSKLIKGCAVAVMVLALAGCQSMTGRTAGQNVDDATITASVKSRLVADQASDLFRVDVDTTNGVVYLNGVVESDAQKQRAEDIARLVQGVEDVVNNLEVAQR
ncbi:MAG: BON domain-containing protein [Nitrospirota bacterium]